MAKVKADRLLTDFQRMLRERWAYEWGGAQQGRVDCAGAFVWAFRQQGAALPHGSNRMARNAVVRLIPVEQARREGLLTPGMAVFKCRGPAAAGYALPARYRPGGADHNGDLNDYYHVGLLDADRTHVLNAQGVRTGFVRSALTENWSHAALLLGVDYEEDTERMTAKVTGGRLILRRGPGKDTAAILSIPDGTRVTVTDRTEGDWWGVTALGRSGYVMARYLSPEDTGDDAAQAEDPNGGQGAVTLTLPVQAAQALLEALTAGLHSA